MKFVRRLLRRPALFVLSLFFDRSYLRGCFFDDSFTGFRWAFRSIWQRNILRLAPPLPFPAVFNCIIADAENIEFSPDDLNNFQTGGTYYQNFSAKIRIGKGTWIAPNVGLITANHDPMNPDRHLPGGDIELGEKCWIGMNSVILPGVVLGENTIVGAGSIVTQSFEHGRCVLAGAPARVVRDLSQDLGGNA